MTAESFGAQMPSVTSFPYSKSLYGYARFTRALVDDATRSGHDFGIVRRQLYQNALRLGKSLRQLFGVSTHSEAMTACGVLYSCIGIDFDGSAENEIVISKCFFSQYYSRETCELISWLDKGLIAGMCGGGEVNFHQRITEGKTCCRAGYSLKGQSS